MRTSLPKPIRTLLIILCLNGLILSAACSQRTFDSTQPSLRLTNAGETTVQEEGDVVISFAANEFHRSLYEPLIEEFNQQNPGIMMQFVPLPQPEPDELLEEADWNHILASAADTTLIHGVWSVGSGVNTYFRDLAPLIEMDPAFASNDFWPGALEACGDQQGHILGIPLQVNISGIFLMSRHLTMQAWLDQRQAGPGRISGKARLFLPRRMGTELVMDTWNAAIYSLPSWPPLWAHISIAPAAKSMLRRCSPNCNGTWVWLKSRLLTHCAN